MWTMWHNFFHLGVQGLLASGRDTFIGSSINCPLADVAPYLSSFVSAKQVFSSTSRRSEYETTQCHSFYTFLILLSTRIRIQTVFL
ncbi:hypothetical protein RB195_011443 [Necator americanus]|uniref:Secreted protein n=1 Tax=Necator americanus TaxID=51031 RepID=A0ABR1D2E7_NECAM